MMLAEWFLRCAGSSEAMGESALHAIASVQMLVRHEVKSCLKGAWAGN